MGVEEGMDVPGGAGASSRHKRSSSSKRKERRDSQEAEPSARVRSHSVAELPPDVMSQLAWTEGGNAVPENSKSRGSTRAKHESGKEREKRASRSRRDRGDELDKQNSCSESSSSSTGREARVVEEDKESVPLPEKPKRHCRKGKERLQAARQIYHCIRRWG